MSDNNKQQTEESEVEVTEAGLERTIRYYAGVPTWTCIGKGCGECAYCGGELDDNDVDTMMNDLIVQHYKEEQEEAERRKTYEY